MPCINVFMKFQWIFRDFLTPRKAATSILWFFSNIYLCIFVAFLHMPFIPLVIKLIKNCVKNGHCITRLILWSRRSYQKGFHVVQSVDFEIIFSSSRCPCQLLMRKPKRLSCSIFPFINIFQFCCLYVQETTTNLCIFFSFSKW